MPPTALGQHTEQAIQSGVVFGSAGAIRELVERFATISGRWPVVFFTGGDAALVTKAADFVDKHVPLLSLRGIVLAYEKAAEDAHASAGL